MVPYSNSRELVLAENLMILADFGVQFVNNNGIDIPARFATIMTHFYWHKVDMAKLLLKYLKVRLSFQSISPCYANARFELIFFNTMMNFILQAWLTQNQCLWVWSFALWG